MTTTTLQQQPQSEAPNLHQRIETAIAKARTATQAHDEPLAAVRWDEAEELLAEAAHQRDQAATNFKHYCNENPWADECRVYDV